MDSTAIRVEGVYKDFLLPHESTNTFKGRFTKIFSRDRSADTQHALKNINLEIKHGEFFGIVGRNGSGKSTLLKIIAGIYQPTKGKVTVNGKLVPFIELGVGFNPELSGRENVYLNGAILGFTRKQIEANYKEIVEFAELEEFMDQKLKNYSSGMQVRLAFACATKAKAEVLLVDEVLAVGDADFQRKCFNYFRELKKNKKTVVFVTHDMNAVREYCDRAVLIDSSEIQYAGRPEEIAQEYSKLFMENSIEAVEGEEKDNRWGNGSAKLNKVTVTQQVQAINITADIVISKTIEKLVYGVHVFSSNGDELTAMNNRMIGAPDIKNLNVGDEVSIVWDMLNVFNDGKYYITLTLVDSVGTVFDWYTEAAKFTVKRQERSTTAIFPPIKVDAKVVSIANRKGV